MSKEKKKEDEIITGYGLFEQIHEPELAQFVPPAKYATHRQCEKCEHYAQIDSAYGYCKRFPPKNVIRINYLWRKHFIEYPTTEWNRKACGEFKWNGKID